VNRGIDDAVSALERLKNNREAKDAGLSPAFLDQKLIEFEMHRASLNGYFTNHLDSAEEARASQLHKSYKQYRRKDLDEVQVYQDVELLEQRRWMEGKRATASGEQGTYGGQEKEKMEMPESC
jgi:hypothetical protein